MACDDFLVPPAVLLQRHATARPSPWSALISLLRCWRARAKERQQLAQMRHHAWRDLGLSDLDLRREVNKPFWRR
jgi:uncharacterized protein YjiS (DUF1127 family)